jgi:hypothetical protein
MIDYLSRAYRTVFFMEKETEVYTIDPATGRRRLKPGRLPGEVRTDKKAQAARANGAMGRGPKNPRGPVPLSEIECCIKVGKAAGSPCLGGDSLEGHHWSCPRGQAIKRRAQEGRDILTGKKAAK